MHAFMPQGARNPCLSASAGTGYEKIPAPVYPLPLGKLGYLGFFKITAMAVINIAERSSESQASVTYEALLLSLLPLNAFSLDKQTDSLGKRQVVIS